MKPLAFRIRDFRSITDSGVVPLSGDNITVLAGQNEAGKTAILLALRDFDLPLGDPSQTPEYMPEENFAATPTVSVQFQLDPSDVIFLNGQHDFPEFTTRLLSSGTLWIERNVETGQFSWDSATDAAWPGQFPYTESGRDRFSGDQAPEGGQSTTCAELRGTGRTWRT